MRTHYMQTQPRILNKLKIIETLCQQSNNNQSIEQTLDKIISQELATAQHKKLELDIDIKQFEDQYQMPSSEFHQKFHTGELGDDVDFVEWNAFYQMSNSLQKQIDLLQSETN
jgi:hypothetical protein